MLWNRASLAGEASKMVESLKEKPPWQRKQESGWLKNGISPRPAASGTAPSSPP